MKNILCFFGIHDLDLSEGLECGVCKICGKCVPLYHKHEEESLWEW